METSKRKIKWSLPHSYTLIFLIIIAIAGLTWVVPSGQFDRQEVIVDGSAKTTIIPGTYHSVAKVSEEEICGRALHKSPVHLWKA